MFFTRMKRMLDAKPVYRYSQKCAYNFFEKLNYFSHLAQTLDSFAIPPIHLHHEICDKLWGTNEWKSAVCLFVISALIKIWTCARKQVICDSFGSGMVSVHWNHWNTATYGLKVWYLAHSFHFNGEYIFDLKTFPFAFFFLVSTHFGPRWTKHFVIACDSYKWFRSKITHRRQLKNGKPFRRKKIVRK